jgi:hypothetical protein
MPVQTSMSRKIPYAQVAEGHKFVSQGADPNLVRN